MTFQKMGAVAGILLVVLLVASFALYGQPPDAKAPANEITQYVNDTSGFALGALVAALGAILILPFGAALTVRFFASDRERGEGYGILIAGSFAAMTAMLGVSAVLLVVLGLRMDELDGPAVRLLWDTSNLSSAFSLLLVVPAAGGVAMAVTKHRLMPAWYGYLSTLEALLALTAIPAFLTTENLSMVWVVAFIGALVWVLAGSVVLLRTPKA